MEGNIKTDHTTSRNKIKSQRAPAPKRTKRAPKPRQQAPKTQKRYHSHTKSFDDNIKVPSIKGTPRRMREKQKKTPAAMETTGHDSKILEKNREYGQICVSFCPFFELLVDGRDGSMGAYGVFHDSWWA